MFGIGFHSQLTVIDNHDKVAPGAEQERVVVKVNFADVRADPSRIDELSREELTVLEAARVHVLAPLRIDEVVGELAFLGSERVVKLDARNLLWINAGIQAR